MKVGLIMIGGSLKGIYGHTGVLRALYQHEINPDIVLGASAGSIISALYASGKTIKDLYDMMTILKPKDFLDPIPRWKIFCEFVFNKARDFTGFMIGNQLENYMIKHLGGNNDFTKTKIPLYIAATNLGTYELVLFRTGTISDKVRASAAIPMLFRPKKIRNEYYIDGAVLRHKLPEELLKIHPDLDLIVISNFSHVPHNIENAYIEDNKLPILEIFRRTLAINGPGKWPKKIGKTHIIHIQPNVRVPVDIFHPDKQIARAVYHEAHISTKQFLEKELKRIKAK